jgi:hypothetical protein
MLAGADSIDDMDVLRAGSTGLILGLAVMAPSTFELISAWENGRGGGRALIGGVEKTSSGRLARISWEGFRELAGEVALGTWG